MERIHARQSSPHLCVRLTLMWRILYRIKRLNLPGSGSPSHSLFSRKMKAVPPLSCGTYTLANKFVSIAGAHLSKTLQKKIAKFSQYDDSLGRFMVSMPLIAQLGRNFNPNLPLSIAGSDLLSMALQRVLDVEYLIGGKTVYIECSNQPKLFDFYSAAGFLAFDKRAKQGSVDEDDVLVQMLKYFNH